MGGLMSASEASAAAQTALASALRAGLDTLSLDQTIVFTKYVRLVLPLDGFVFWVRADLLSPSALINASRLNTYAPNQPASIITPAPTVTAMGALHYSSDSRQEETESYTANHVVFTSEINVDDFNQVGPNVLLLGTFEGMRFAFNRRGAFFRQANLYHYTGDAVYSVMETQFIDSLDGLDTTSPVISSSLALWLALSTPTGIPTLGGVGFPLFPSFAVPENCTPPFAAVHVVPETTAALQPLPFNDRLSSHWQLTTERVRITTYGVRNNAAADFMDYVLDYSYNTDHFGIMGGPTIRDDRYPQPEVNVLAIKKTIEFTISYYQSRVNDVARQLILSALINDAPLGPSINFYDNGGVLCVSPLALYPTDPSSLATGAVWSNSFGGTVCVAGSPSGGSQVITFGNITPAQLLASGAANLPLSPGYPGSLQIWNNGGELAIS